MSRHVHELTQEAIAYAAVEYWINFTVTARIVRFGGVHAFGYDSAESKPIWMKPGAL